LNDILLTISWILKYLNYYSLLDTSLQYTKPSSVKSSVIIWCFKLQQMSIMFIKLSTGIGIINVSCTLCL